MAVLDMYVPCNVIYYSDYLHC